MKQLSNGPFRAFIDKYLELRRSLGAILKSAEYALNRFDLYLSHSFPDIKIATRPMIVDYFQTFNHVQAATLYQHFMHVRQFCRYLFQLNSHSYIPETRLIQRGQTLRLPHIYSPGEVTGLIKLARTLTPHSSLRPHTYSTLIPLLWVSGLRIREALKLNLADVDIENAVLNIRESKFFKSRLVPLTLSSASALETYRRLRAEHGYDQRPEAPFFVNNNGRGCSHSIVGVTFRRLIQQLGIRTIQGNIPRLHDFRHTFATRYLNEIYQNGKNPNTSLPLLATYLGHVKISCTQIYLHPSTGLLAIAGQRFFEHFHESGSVLKEADDEQS